MSEANEEYPRRTGSASPVKWRGRAMFSSAHVEWGTPPDLREALTKEFNFTLDPCTPGQIWDGRQISWNGQRVFCNPPYGRQLGTWLAKGPEADVAVFLVPARTDTGWFHDYALKATEIRFFRGRLKFCENHVAPHKGWSGGGAPFPSMLVIYRNAHVCPTCFGCGSDLFDPTTACPDCTPNARKSGAVAPEGNQ